MIREGVDPITESVYLYCDACGATFPIDAADTFHICNAATDEPIEADPLGALTYQGA